MRQSSGMTRKKRVADRMAHDTDRGMTYYKP